MESEGQSLASLYKIDKQLNGTVQKAMDVYTFYNKKTKLEEGKMCMPQFQIDKWVRHHLKYTTNMVVAKSGRGKTVFTTFLIQKFIRNNPEERVGIVLCATNKVAYNRLFAASKMASKPFLTKEQVFFTRNFQDMMDIYCKLKKRHSDDDDTGEITPDTVAKTPEERAVEKVLDGRIAALIDNWTHFIFYFDDVNAMLKNATKQVRILWQTLPTESRHANLTLIINAQDIDNIASELKSNVSTVYMMGYVRNANKHFKQHMPPLLESDRRYTQFFTQSLRAILKQENWERVITVFTDRKHSSLRTDGLPCLPLYTVSKKFASALDAYEQSERIAAENKRKEKNRAILAQPATN